MWRGPRLLLVAVMAAPRMDVMAAPRIMFTHSRFQLGYPRTEGVNSLMKENSGSNEDEPPVGWHRTSDDNIPKVLTKFVKTKCTIFNSTSLEQFPCQFR